MTKAKAEVLRARWKEHGYRVACTHLIRIEKVDEVGDSTGFFVCNLCGESVADRDLAA
jgi:predicted SprT family Zn-dependent metalloprotease